MGDEFSVLESRQITSENIGTFAPWGPLNSMNRGLNCRATVRLVRYRGTRRTPGLRHHPRTRRLHILFQPAQCWAKDVRVSHLDER
jgi:hypothetical protein